MIASIEESNKSPAPRAMWRKIFPLVPLSLACNQQPKAPPPATSPAYEPARVVVPTRRDAAALPSGVISPGDLDDDGLDDCVVLVNKTPSTNGIAKIIAISSNNRKVLWSTDTPLSPPTSTAPADGDESPSLIVDGLRPLPDANADDVPDLIAFSAGERPGFATISGLDGTIIGINTTPKDQLLHLVDARELTGDDKLDLVFAYREPEAAPNQPAERVSFVVYSCANHKPVVRFKKPFNRLTLRQDLLLGDFPDTNDDGIDEILCFGVMPAFANRPEEGQFALVDGQRLKRWVLTRTTEDPVKAGSYIAVPGVIVPDNFPDLVISTPANAALKTPSMLGLYAMKQQKYVWSLPGNAVAADALKLLSAEGATTTAAGVDLGFGAPVRAVPDLDGDGLQDAVTTLLDPRDSSRRVIVAVSSKTGKLIQCVDASQSGCLVGPDASEAQLAMLGTNDENGPVRIAVTGSAIDKADALGVVGIITLPKRP